MPVTPLPKATDWTQPGQNTEEARAERAAYWQTKKREVSSQSEDLSINREDYRVAPEGVRMDMAREGDQMRDRAAVKLDRRGSDAALAESYGARARQQEAIRLQALAAQGIGPSAAQENMRAALDAQARQAAQMGGARGIQASTGGYSAANAGAASARQAEIQGAYRGVGTGLHSMRGADVRTFDQSQNQNFSQAQLEQAQRARNDAMTRAYLGEQTSMSLEQLDADMAYEAQQAANKAAIAADLEAERRQKNEEGWNSVGLAMKVAGTVTGMGGVMGGGGKAY